MPTKHRVITVYEPIAKFPYGIGTDTVMIHSTIGTVLILDFPKMQRDFPGYTSPEMPFIVNQFLRVEITGSSPHCPHE
jgi:hypothetical protein